MEEAVANYSPRSPEKITDLTVPPTNVLKGLPGVQDVQIQVQHTRPQRRIIHLRQWHFVPRDLFAREMRADRGDVTDEEIDLHHQSLLLEIELVQIRFKAMLRCMIRHHGLEVVYVEGLTEKGMRDFLSLIVFLREQKSSAREDLLRIGAAGQLLLSADLKGVLPLDDLQSLGAAAPDKQGRLSSTFALFD